MWIFAQGTRSLFEAEVAALDKTRRNDKLLRGVQLPKEMPITQQCYHVLYENGPIDEVVENLMKRPMIQE